MLNWPPWEGKVNRKSSKEQRLWTICVTRRTPWAYSRTARRAPWVPIRESIYLFLLNFPSRDLKGVGGKKGKIDHILNGNGFYFCGETLIYLFGVLVIFCSLLFTPRSAGGCYQRWFQKDSGDWTLGSTYYVMWPLPYTPRLLSQWCKRAFLLSCHVFPRPVDSWVRTALYPITQTPPQQHNLDKMQSQCQDEPVTFSFATLTFFFLNSHFLLWTS